MSGVSAAQYPQTPQQSRHRTDPRQGLEDRWAAVEPVVNIDTHRGAGQVIATAVEI